MHLQHRKIKEKQNRLAKSTTSKGTLWGKMQKALQNPLVSLRSEQLLATQIQATALRREKNEGMVCIVHGAAVLISRREQLNPVVLGFLAP